MTEILRTEHVTKSFGGLVAVNDVDITIEEGKILGLIGPNGAGKTTLFNCITGVYPISNGEIYFKGDRITKLKQDSIVRTGLCRTFQELRIFKNLSVLQNVLIGMHTRSKGSVIDAILYLPRTKAEEKRAKEKALHYLNLLGIADRAESKASSLPYADQRRVEVARALAAEPELLLLDEPAAGMNVSESHTMTEFIKWLNVEMKKTILLIEHNMRVVMPVADRVVVLNMGKKIAEGTPTQIQSSKEVIEAYLGREYVAQEVEKNKYA
jgi:branched-chain amino acid transport system ATP-binding protein